MDTQTIRQKLYEYIKIADDEKVEAIYTILKNDLNETYEWWNNDELVAELDRRSDALKNGADKGISWEAAKELLLNRSK